MLSIQGDETTQSILRLNATLVTIANHIKENPSYQLNGATYFDDVINVETEMNILLELLKGNFGQREKETSARLAYNNAQEQMKQPPQ